MEFHSSWRAWTSYQYVDNRYSFACVYGVDFSRNLHCRIIWPRVKSHVLYGSRWLDQTIRIFPICFMNCRMTENVAEWSPHTICLATTRSGQDLFAQTRPLSILALRLFQYPFSMLYSYNPSWNSLIDEMDVEMLISCLSVITFVITIAYTLYYFTCFRQLTTVEENYVMSEIVITSSITSLATIEDQYSRLRQ